MPDITLSIQNTLILTTGAITRLRASGNISINKLNLMNLGPGAVWLRSEADPAVGDPQSEKLPANVADNGISFQSFVGLIAEADTAVVTRLVP